VRSTTEGVLGVVTDNYFSVIPAERARAGIHNP
jgi:hypothetical protein